MNERINRRTIARGALGLALALPAVKITGARAQESTPAAATPGIGYAVTRIHTLNAPELVAEIDALVVEQFVPQVQALSGYRGYLLADSLDDPAVNFTISLFDAKASTAASTDASKAWVATLDPKFEHPAPMALDGDIFVAASPANLGTPTPTGAAAGDFVVVRHYQGADGKDQTALAPLIIEGFLPIVASVDGFRGYIWYTVPDGRVSVSLFTTKEASEASTQKAADWVAVNSAEYTDGKPDVYNGKLVFADVPMLT